MRTRAAAVRVVAALAARAAAVTAAVTAALVLVTAACEAPPPEGTDEVPAADGALRAVDDTAPGTPPDTAAADPVRVWFLRGEALVPVERPEVERTPRSALESLVAGPTSDERSRGLTSWFGDETRDVVRDVRAAPDRLVVDFRQSLPERIPGAASSAGSQVLLAALDSTVFQFPGVEAVEYRLGGSCDAFWEWLQRECVVVRR